MCVGKSQSLILLLEQEKSILLKEEGQNRPLVFAEKVKQNTTHSLLAPTPTLSQTLISKHILSISQPLTLKHIATIHSQYFRRSLSNTLIWGFCWVQLNWGLISS